MLPRLHFYFFAPVVGGGRYTQLKAPSCIDFLFIIIIVTKLAAGFCHCNMFQLCYLFKLENNLVWLYSGMYTDEDKNLGSLLAMLLPTWQNGKIYAVHEGAACCQTVSIIGVFY